MQLHVGRDFSVQLAAHAQSKRSSASAVVRPRAHRSLDVSREPIAILVLSVRSTHRQPLAKQMNWICNAYGFSLRSAAVRFGEFLAQRGRALGVFPGGTHALMGFPCGLLAPALGLLVTAPLLTSTGTCDLRTDCTRALDQSRRKLHRPLAERYRFCHIARAMRMLFRDR